MGSTRAIEAIAKAKEALGQNLAGSVYSQNLIEEGLTISIKSSNPAAPGEISMPLSEFLRKFGKQSERVTVRDAVHACLRSSRRN